MFNCLLISKKKIEFVEIKIDFGATAIMILIFESVFILVTISTSISVDCKYVGENKIHI